MSQHATVLILNYGSQYTQLIARRVRELGIYSLILNGDCEISEIEQLHPKALILSGGPASVYDEGAPQLPHGFFEYCEKNQIPVLGICYGMQLLAHTLGGQVEKASVREYGKMQIHPHVCDLFSSSSSQQVWMSHGDEIKTPPPGFQILAKSDQGSPAAMGSFDKKIFALQFHPEVTHTEHGKEILQRFLLGISSICPDWNMSEVISDQIQSIQKTVGPKDHVLCALSGGVDSTVAAVLVHQAIGERLHCVFVDHGLLRFQEQERVMRLFQDQLHLPVHCVDASERFLNKLDGIQDPEKKRKIIGAEFISVFEEAAQRIRAQVRILPKYLVQGTLYPDIIESSTPRGGVSKLSTTIKSHHNVGGLPQTLRFQLIEPFRDLFKDEVRELGKKLRVPEAFLNRHPFPGPGLAVRIIGTITRPHLEILRQVDEIFIQALHEAGLYHQIWQAFAVFLPIKSVGVQGDGRTHEHVVALRAVTSLDGMTADWFHFDPQFLALVSSRICNQVRGVNRVVYDISSKPPATIEWE